MHFVSRLWICACTVWVVAAIAGCGSGNDATVNVVGNVTYDGAPIEVGRVEFLPQDVTVSGTFTAEIENGQYAFRGDKALPSGSYRVEVRGFRNQDGSTTAIDFSNPEASYVQYVPNKYNRMSQLTATIEEETGGEVRHDFDLEK